MNAQSKINNTWSWTVEHSPLLHLSRWILNRGYPHLKTNQLLTESDLPTQLQSLIHITVYKTRLWKSERIDITKELIAHTQDALEAGRTPDQITTSFGNPKKVAKLLRRATKRKRPLYWRTLRNIRRTITTAIALLFISYAALATRFYIGQPNITKNYALEINAQNDIYTDDQKAWPIYKEINDAWKLHIEETQARQIENEILINQTRYYDEDPISAGLYIIPHLPTDHHDYEETAQLFRDFKPHFDQLRQAAHRPAIGIQLGFRQGTNWDTPIPPETKASDNPPLIDLLLPHLGTMRQFSNILYFDAILAAHDNNPDLVYQNLSAMLAMSRQHTTDGTLIADLVNLAMINNTTNAITEILRDHPNTLSRDHLVDLTHELALCRPKLNYSFNGEIMFFEDFIQRAYTDEGDGNGRMTMQGMDLIAGYADLSYKYQNMDLDFEDIKTSNIRYATSPLSLTLVPDRKSIFTKYHAMMDTIKSVADQGPHLLPLIDELENQIQRESNTIPGMRYSLIDIMMPAVGRAVERLFIARTELDATLTMLALEIYQHDHNTYPLTLADLTPSYIPQLPSDLCNPGNPLKYKPTPTGYLIYSVGTDADDDQGTSYDTENQYIILNQRFRPTYDKHDSLLLDNAGNPVLAQPRGPDGDWILIDVTRTPKTKEPDQSPALETLN